MIDIAPLVAYISTQPINKVDSYLAHPMQERERATDRKHDSRGPVSRGIWAPICSMASNIYKQAAECTKYTSHDRGDQEGVHRVDLLVDLLPSHLPTYFALTLVVQSHTSQGKSTCACTRYMIKRRGEQYGMSER